MTRAEHPISAMVRAATALPKCSYINRENVEYRRCRIGFVRMKPGHWRAGVSSFRVGVARWLPR